MSRTTTSFGRDPGLQARMLLTLLGLGVVYTVLVAALLAAGAGALTVAVIATAMFVVQLLASDRLALRAMGAHAVSPEQAPDLHAMIERLCVQANLPKPRVAIAETEMPNAFALGALAAFGDGVRHHGDPRPAVTGGARGSARARARPRQAPRRDGDDPGVLLRDDRGLHHADKLDERPRERLGLRHAP